MAEHQITRRKFLYGAIGVGGVVATGGLALTLDTASAAKRPPTGGAGGYPLQRLSVVGPGPLAAAPGSVRIGSRTARGFAYNGTIPGPVFAVRTGDAVSIPFTNRLSQPTTVHWHGLVVPQEMDGQPQDPVAPGSTFTYAFPVRQRAGLSFYHPHPHHATSSQVALGLSGGFLIRDDEEDALRLPAGEFEVPLVLRDANFDKAGNLTYNGTASGYTGKTLLTNGTELPFLDAQPAIYRLRIVCGSNSRVYRLALSTGAPLTIIGNDGGLLPATATATEIELSSGERLDLIVDLRTRAGQTVSLLDRASGTSVLDLRVANVAPVGGTVPSGVLSTVAPLPSATQQRTFSFDGMTKINGRLFSMDRIDFEVRAGEVEDWTFKTNGNAPHPVHVHGASFQVLSRTGGRGKVFPWEAGWKDTVLLNDGETVTVRIRFELTGRYLMHCHKLEHEDAGMMANFRVV